MEIKIKYDGQYPHLCGGHLLVTVDGNEYDFGCHRLSSGGSQSFDEGLTEHIYSGPWKVDSWPDNFPKQYRFAVVATINDKIEHGCCGGCT